MDVLGNWIKWLDEDNPVQVEWSLQYLQLQNIPIDHSIFNDYGKVVHAIQRLCHGADRRLFMRGMRCAWSQKKYRDGLKASQSGTYNHVMTKATRKQLNSIAKSRKCTLNAALDLCIKGMAGEIKQEQQVVSALREQHKKDMDGLKERLNAALKSAGEWERQFHVVEAALQEGREVVVQDLEQLPVLKQSLQQANDELARWKGQSEAWLKQACEWEILAKANGLQGHTLNPDQADQSIALQKERLAQFLGDK